MKYIYNAIWFFFYNIFLGIVIVFSIIFALKYLFFEFYVELFKEFFLVDNNYYFTVPFIIAACFSYYRLRKTNEINAVSYNDWIPKFLTKKPPTKP